MRILTLTSEGIKPAVATVFKDKDKSHYNIKHGSRGKDTHVLSYGLDKTFFDPVKLDQSTYELKDDNYILIPIKKDGIQVKDRNGNCLYSISIDNVRNHKKDAILILEIPNNNYTEVNFTTTGNVSVLGQGIIGKTRSDKLYSSPAPILEIYGDCVLTWTGKNGDDIVTGGFVYNRVSNDFTIK